MFIAHKEYDKLGKQRDRHIKDWRDSNLLRQVINVAICCLSVDSVYCQGQNLDENPFVDSSTVDDEWSPIHPTGETAVERMLVLAHTDALPRFDRIELYALESVDPQLVNRAIQDDSRFPILAEGISAKILAHRTILGKDCDEFRKRWRSLTFDGVGGALCHHPSYGFRIYRKQELLFATTIGWRSQNFAIPIRDSGEATHKWYGFSNDEHAASLRDFMISLLPHPKNGNPKGQLETPAK